jgi:hypothetical protein
MSKSKSRHTRLGEAVLAIRTALVAVEDLRDEMESWRDSIPENLQGGDKYQRVEECHDLLETHAEEIDTACEELDAVEFPGMFG